MILYVGRIAAEKGIEHLLEAARRLPDAHVVLAGPDDRHGTMATVRAALGDPATAGRVHLLPPTRRPALRPLSPRDVFVLASGGENFGLVAAEAAAVGTPVVVSDRSGVAASFDEGEALVVPYDEAATVDAVARVLARRRAPGARSPAGALRAARAIDLGRRRRRAGRDLREDGRARALTPGSARRRATATRFSMLGS